MTKKSPSIISKLYPVTFVALLLFLWWAVCFFGVVPGFMLPSPQKVAATLITEFPNMLPHAAVSLQESFYGLGSSIAAAFVLSVLMDRFEFLRRSVYPVVVLTQTIPTIAMAPILVLWLGYGILPKVVLIFITCFFPLVISLLGGFQSVDRDIVRLYHSMGATRNQILWQVKVPSALDSFFSGLRVSAAYSIVGAVIAEWLGGNNGLGVYMTRARKSYAYDKMFAVIILISVLSLLLMKLVDILHRRAMPWKKQ
ncbi:ABC transporter permease [Bacilliculturomica massiliensis]|uniref:ABC transporter permease n=1 Tax=Bacilliculturomica massiliensis TaxID=1917867 RepID=UPI00102FA49D|nr:ABC transporter permease [Bacilliculturomica massiliensis]